MLNGIPKNVSPELIKALMEMGHGDEIVLTDGNYPATSSGNAVLVRCIGLGVPELLESILTLMPLDDYVESPVARRRGAAHLGGVPAHHRREVRRREDLAHRARRLHRARPPLLRDSRDLRGGHLRQHPAAQGSRAVARPRA